MSIVEIVILGIIQGLTEFLPVSSSGHLVILKGLLGVDSPGMLLEILLHLGTLIAVFVVFWKDIYLIIRDLKRSIMKLISKRGIREVLREDQYTMVFLMIILATIPTGIIALLFKGTFERLFNNPLMAGAMIMTTGTILWFTRFVRNQDKKAVGFFGALIIGIAQGIAITPGISRSGTTISAASLMGIERGLAARFSFLLSIPAIIGATVLECGKVTTGAINMQNVVIGMFTATLIGYLSLRLLVNIVKNGKFYRFAYYCWPAGLIAVIIFMLK